MTYQDGPYRDYNPQLHPRPRRRVWPWAIVVAVLVVGGCLGGIGSLVFGTSEVVRQVEQEQTERTADVKIVSCNADSTLGLVEVHYTVTNSGTVPRQYFPSFDLVAKDATLIGEAIDLTAELQPGETYKGVATGSASQPGKITCRLNDA